MKCEHFNWNGQQEFIEALDNRPSAWELVELNELLVIGQRSSWSAQNFSLHFNIYLCLNVSDSSTTTTAVLRHH